jgi:hypothetical protein
VEEEGKDTKLIIPKNMERKKWEEFFIGSYLNAYKTRLQLNQVRFLNYKASFRCRLKN